MDIFGRFARDPACLVAIDAADGGTWRSPFRPGVVYPSSVPRNFVAEPATWHDLGRALSLIGMDDWELSGEVFIHSLTATRQIIYRGSPGFGLYVNTTNSIQLINYTVDGGGSIFIYTNPPVGEWIRFKIQRRDGWARFYINDIEVKAEDKSGLYKLMNTSTLFIVNEDCNLRGCAFKNLTTGKILWAYPSFEEQTRLITKANVWTTNGCFEQASSSSRWAVSTPLSLTGMAAAMTFVCRCKFVTAASGFQVAFSDGNPLSGNPATEGLHLTYWVAGNLIRANMRTTAGGAPLSVTSPAAFLDKWVTYALVIDSATTSMKLYADGILIGSVVSANISQVIGGYTSKLKISSDIVGVAATALNQVKNLLIFDWALSIGEIQTLR